MGEAAETKRSPLEVGLAVGAVLTLACAGVGWGDVLLVLAALATTRHGSPLGLRSPLVLLLGGVLAASHLAAADGWSSCLALAQWTRIALAFWVGAAWPGAGARRCRRLASGLAVAALLLAAHAAWQVFVLQPGLVAAPSGLDARVALKLAEGRAHSVFLLPGHLGAMAAAIAVLLVAAALAARLERSGALTWLLAGGCLAALAALLLSRSLAGALLLAGGLSLVAVCALEGRRRTLFLASGLGLALLVGGGAAWSRGANLSADNPLTARARNWVAAVRLIRERPLLGWGGGAFAHEYGRVRPPGANETRHAHEAALERAAEHGLVMLPLLAAFVAWLAGLASRTLRGAGSASERLWLAAPFGAAAVLLGQGLLDFGWSQPAWAAPAALLVGVAASLRPASRRSRVAALDLLVVVALGAGLLMIASRDALEDQRLRGVVAAARRGEHVAAAGLAHRARLGNPLSSRTWASESEAVLASAGDDPELADLAVSLAEEAVRRSPRRAALHGLRARALLAAGRRLEAWFAAERAAALAPTVEEWRALRDSLRPAAETTP